VRSADRVDRSLEIDVEHLVEVLARGLEEQAVGADAGI